MNPLVLLRLDTWVNALTGMNTWRDKTTATQFQADEYLLPNALTAMYVADDMIRKIVSIFPREALRQGFVVKCASPEWSSRLQKVCQRIKLGQKLFDVSTWGRLYGGALLWPVADDGRPINYPLGRVKSLSHLEVFDRRYAFPWSFFGAGGFPDMAHPRSYALYPLSGQIEAGEHTYTNRNNIFVHESRVIRFGGAHTDELTKRNNAGWDLSIIQALQEPIKHFHETFSSSRLMMADASQSVFKLKGLFAALAGTERNAFIARAQLMDMTRSIARAVFLDADMGETFEKVATSFAGVADNLAMACKRLSAATDIPVAILMGETPSGLQATGQLDIRIFYDRVQSEREQIYEPAILRVLKMIAQAEGYEGDLSITWPSLWQMSPLEEAQVQKTVAERDQIYIASEVLSPETIAKSRFKPDGWSAETEIDPNDTPAWELPPPPGLQKQATKAFGSEATDPNRQTTS